MVFEFGFRFEGIRPVYVRYVGEEYIVDHPRFSDIMEKATHVVLMNGLNGPWIKHPTESNAEPTMGEKLDFYALSAVVTSDAEFRDVLERAYVPDKPEPTRRRVVQTHTRNELQNDIEQWIKNGPRTGAEIFKNLYAICVAAEADVLIDSETYATYLGLAKKHLPASAFNDDRKPVKQLVDTLAEYYRA